MQADLENITHLEDRSMTQRNPIYQSMLRTRLIFKMMRDFETSPGSKALFDQFRNEMSVIRDLSARGAIPFDFQSEISRRAARSIHAAAILHFRKQSTLVQRRRLSRTAREAASHSARW